MILTTMMLVGLILTTTIRWEWQQVATSMRNGMAGEMHQSVRHERVARCR